MSYIAADNTSALVAIILILTWFGFWIDNTKLGKVFPGVIVIISMAAALSNLKITPFAAPSYNFIGDYMVPAAIPLLMLKADLRKIFVESGKVMLGFAIACVGITLGVLVGYYILDLGPIGPQVSGVFAGGFIGGSISMVAVAKGVGMSASDLTTAIGASTLPSVLGLFTLVAIPTFSFVQKHIPSRIMEEARAAEKTTGQTMAIPQFRLDHIAGALALAFGICAAARVASELMTGLIGHDQTQYTILYVTGITVIVANLFPKPLSRLGGDFELGMLFMYVFFAMIGFGTNIFSFLDNAIGLFYFVLILLAVNFIFVLVMAKILKLDLAEAITGCGAAIVGPAATVAVVAGKGWQTMVTPAVMTGIFCHVVGNFVGISLTALLH